MPVRNIECQIATNQIGRYLGGEALSPETLKQLEAHIAECPSCRTGLTERKAALQSMLGGEEKVVAKAVVSAPVEAKNPVAEALRKAAEAERFSASEELTRQIAAAKGAKPKEPILTKPILMMLGLAGVLTAMSFIAKSGMLPMGQTSDKLFETKPVVKAVPARPTATPKKEEPKPVTEPVAKPTPSTSSVVTKPTPSETSKQPQLKETTATETKPLPQKPAQTPAPVAKPVPPKAKPVAITTKPVHKKTKHVAKRKPRHLKAGTGFVKIYK